MTIIRLTALTLGVLALTTACGGRDLADRSAGPRPAPPAVQAAPEAAPAPPPPAPTAGDQMGQPQPVGRDTNGPEQPERLGEWQRDPTSGWWIHDSGILQLDPTGNGVLYETVYGYVADFNIGLVFDPFVQQWVDPSTYYGGSGGSGWNYSSAFGYGMSDGSSTGFGFGNGCTVLDGSVLC